MRFRRLLPVFVVLAAFAFPATGSANDLPNGSFENRLQSWAPMSSALAIRAGGVHGARYARATFRRGTAFGLFTTPSLDLDAGQSISARASIRAPRGKQVCVRIRERRAGKLVAQAVRCVASTGGWQRPPGLGYTVRRGDSTLALAVFERRTRARNWIDVDNVVLNVVPLGTPPAGTVIVTNRPWSCTGPLSGVRGASGQGRLDHRQRQRKRQRQRRQPQRLLRRRRPGDDRPDPRHPWQPRRDRHVLRRRSHRPERA